MRIFLSLLAIAVSLPAAAQWRVASDQTVTDWNTGLLSHWSEKGGIKQLASGFKGPADFTVVPGDGGSMTVVVPDLVQSQLRFIQLRR